MERMRKIFLFMFRFFWSHLSSISGSVLDAQGKFLFCLQMGKSMQFRSDGIIYF